MKTRITLLFFAGLFFVTLFLSGCQTTKNVTEGIADGVPKDAKNAWAALQNADEWIKKHTW